jgi:hypothetical protein
MNIPSLLTNLRRFRLSLLLSLAAFVPAADTSLVPTTPSTVPDYF